MPALKNKRQASSVALFLHAHQHFQLFQVNGEFTNNRQFRPYLVSCKHFTNFLTQEHTVPTSISATPYRQPTGWADLLHKSHVCSYDALINK